VKAASRSLDVKPLRRLSQDALRTSASASDQTPENPPEKRPVTLDLKPTPFLPVPDLTLSEKPPLGAEYNYFYSHPCHLPSVQTFYYWTYQRIGTALWPAYRFAQELGIHRCSVGEWLTALSWAGYLVEGTCERFDTVIPCYGVREPSARERAVIEHVEITVAVTPYDPWTDRAWDSHFINWTHPYFIDEFVDTHFSVFVDEQHIHTGSRRKRGNGQVFLPMANARDAHDHPLYWTQATETAPGLYRIRLAKGAARYFQENGRPKAPPQSRRRQIDQACNGGAPGIRRRFSAAEETEKAPEKADLESWIDPEFIARCQAVESGGHTGKASKPLKRLKP
jgi:hypothetical protein